MDSYEVPEPPAETVGLPSPREVPESSDALGNTVLQVVGGVQVVAGLVLLLAALSSVAGIYRAPGIATSGTNLVIVVLAALGFLVIGVFLFVTVANARLSDRFRAAEYRERLRAIGLEDGERPAFLGEIEGVDLENAPPLRTAPGDDEDAGADAEAEPADDSVGG